MNVQDRVIVFPGSNVASGDKAAFEGRLIHPPGAGLDMCSVHCDGGLQDQECVKVLVPVVINNRFHLERVKSSIVGHQLVNSCCSSDIADVYVDPYRDQSQWFLA